MKRLNYTHQCYSGHMIRYGTVMFTAGKLCTNWFTLWVTGHARTNELAARLAVFWQVINMYLDVHIQSYD